MALKVKMDFGRQFENLQKALDDSIVKTLTEAGEKAVAMIVDKGRSGAWQDRTTDLRASVGYGIVHNGELIQIDGFYNGRENGAAEGRKFLESLVPNHSKDYVLLVVAGMYYAVFVQALNGYDVTNQAELFLKKEIPMICNKVQL